MFLHQRYSALESVIPHLMRNTGNFKWIPIRPDFTISMIWPSIVPFFLVADFIDFADLLSRFIAIFIILRKQFNLLLHKMLIWVGGGKWGIPKTHLINLPRLLSIYQFVRGP